VKEKPPEDIVLKKEIGIGLAIIAWLGGAIGFYLQIRTSGLSESVQVALLMGWIAAGVVASAYFLGLEIGNRKAAKSFQDLGILRGFRRGTVDSAAPSSKFIEKATSDVFFMGLSLPKLDAFTGLLEDKAGNGVQVRLLVPDPREEWLVLAIARFLKREGPYPRELSWFFNNFLPVWKKTPNAFHVRVHKKMPTMTASMFDNKHGTIELYMYGWRTDDRIVLELDYDGKSKDWKANLDTIWHEATPLSSEEMFRECARAADRIAQATDKVAARP
jgi:hypothetical protein